MLWRTSSLNFFQLPFLLSQDFTWSIHLIQQAMLTDHFSHNFYVDFSLYFMKNFPVKLYELILLTLQNHCVSMLKKCTEEFYRISLNDRFPSRKTFKNQTASFWKCSVFFFISSKCKSRFSLSTFISKCLLSALPVHWYVWVSVKIV